MNHFLINELLLMAYLLKQLSVGSVFFVYSFGSGYTNDYKKRSGSIAVYLAQADWSGLVR
jgi:hypothetical protein